MNFQLDTNVWFGNWESPFELKDKVKTIINVAHYFSKRKGRNIYWQRLEELPSDILYVRIAKKDHDFVDSEYFTSIVSAIEIAIYYKKLPILCHCQMGGHRGPTAAICASWVINGKSKFVIDSLVSKATELRPRYSRCVETPYRKSMIHAMTTNSVVVCPQRNIDHEPNRPNRAI